MLHLEEPMDLLKKRGDSLLQTSSGKAVVRRYNKMALALMEYEILHYQGWVKIIEVGRRNVQVRVFPSISHTPIPLVVPPPSCSAPYSVEWRVCSSPTCTRPSSACWRKPSGCRG